MHTFAVTVEESGSRLDKVIAGRIPELSRTRAQTLINGGHVRRNGATVSDCALAVKPGDSVTVAIPAAEPSDLRATPMPLTILYEDKHVLVLDKPAGLTVHPGAGNHQDTLVNALLAYCGKELSGIGGVQRPGIVHRLDKDTSGLMVVAKTDKAHHALADQLQKRTLQRTYLALVWGVPGPSQGEIAGNIGRSPKNRKKMAVLRTGGKKALTRYRVFEVFCNGLASLVECKLHTGRTHQIRVHFTHAGYSLIGDRTYGNPKRKLPSSLPEEAARLLHDFPRQALHACRIVFKHPDNDKEMIFESNIPVDLQEVVEALKNL